MRNREKEVLECSDFYTRCGIILLHCVLFRRFNANTSTKNEVYIQSFFFRETHCCACNKMCDTKCNIAQIVIFFGLLSLPGYSVLKGVKGINFDTCTCFHVIILTSACISHHVNMPILNLYPSIHLNKDGKSGKT